MKVAERDLHTLRGWPAGIDNRSPEESLAADEDGNTIALREAQNVDLHHGKVSRRPGRALADAGTPRSLWRDGDMPFALFAEGAMLKGWYGPGQAFNIDSNLSTHDLSYELVNDRVYWTDGARNGVVLMDGTAQPLGCPNPAGQPALSANATVGGLHAGNYQVAVTFVTASGEESGTVLAASVVIPEGGGINLTNVPPAPGSVSMVRVYVSPADGDALYYATDLAPGQAQSLIGAHTPGKPLATQFMEPMPAGHTIRWLNGRLFVASDEALVWSESLRYGLTRFEYNRLEFAQGLRLMEPIGAGGGGAGVFVADGTRTYWMGGTDPDKWNQRIVYGYGAVKGTAVRVPASIFGLESTETVLYWMASNGVGVIGMPGGQVLPQREGQTVAPAAESGASLLREQDGHRQVVTALHNTHKRNLAIGDSMVVEVFRHDQT